MQYKNMKDLDAKKLLDLLEISRFLATSNDLDEILQIIIRAASELFKSERATVFLYDRKTEELYVKAALEELAVRFSVRDGIAGAAATSQDVIIVENAYLDSRFNQKVDRDTGFLTRNIMAGPILDYNNELVGVLEIINLREGTFKNWHIDLLEILSAQAGVALQRSDLIRSQIEKVRLDNEIDIARRIQERSLPQSPDSVPGYTLDVLFRPADHVGGDCYDFIDLDDGRMLIILGDATGHGIGPALISTQTRALIRGLSSTHLTLPEISRKANDILVEELPCEKFITLFIGLLDTNNHSLLYISAGQEPNLFWNDKTGSIEALKSTGIPLGMLPGSHHSEYRTLKFSPNDSLMLLTDGFPEYRNGKGEFFGLDALSSLLERGKHKTIQQTLSTLMDEINVFSEGANQDDDLTAILLKRNPLN